MSRSPRASSLLVLALLLATHASRPAFAAWTHDNVNGGLPIATGAFGVSQPVSLPDGAGGAFLAWSDQRFGLTQVYAQHVNAYGVPLWGANGVGMTTWTGFTQASPALDTDGAGGIIVAWADQRSGNWDIYAQHVSAAGATTWGTSGVVITNFAGDQTAPSIAVDDLGGAYVGWVDARPTNLGMYFNHVYANGGLQYGNSGYAFSAGTAVGSGRIMRDGAGGVVTVFDQVAVNHDIYAARVSAAGALVYFTTVCSAAGDQLTPALCTDGANGIMVAWQDKRTNANGDIYVQRVWYSGAPLLAANGVLVSTGTTTHATPQIVPDAAGGAIVTWYDSRVGYTGAVAQHVTANGITTWTTGGVLLASSIAATNFSTAPDGYGGLLASWSDYRSGGSDTWATRLNAAGVPQWGSGGAPVNLNPSQDNEDVICADGRGGAIVAFIDSRSLASSFDLFASHLDAWGILGAEPVLAGVKDVPNDNGGHVRVAWYASPLESDPSSVGVSSYYVFRSAPASVAAAAQRAGRVTTSLAAIASAPDGARPLLARPEGANTYFWELVASQGAYHLPTYSVVATTTGDSMGVGNPKTAFLIQAYAGSGVAYWPSAPDSGYSVDNVPPIVPAPFTGTYAAGTASLHWSPNPEVDLANYRLYRGTTPSFVANPASLVATPADTVFADVAGTTYWYKLSAVDIHGNESPLATLLPAGTLDAGGAALPREVALAAPSPNPAHGATTIAFALPHASRVRLAVYDAAGRLVRTLLDGERPAGAQRFAFEPRDAAGRALGAGVYLVRLDAEGVVRTARFTTIR